MVGHYSVQNADSNRWSVVADAIGMLAIGVQLYLVVRWLVPDDGSRIIVGIVAFIPLTGLALYFWHKEPPVEHLSTPSDWALAILGSVLIGGISFGADMLIGLITNPKLSPIEAGTKAGSPFGFLLTLMLCPGLTMVAIAGLLRATILQGGTTKTNQT